MLKRVLMTCRYGCKYKGEGCLSGPQHPAAVRSQAYQASLERCARANKQESEELLSAEADGQLEEHQFFEPPPGSRTSSIVRTGDCRAEN